MKAVILAGGFGTRIAEESDFRPKPMIEIGGRPILWHIMKIYSKHGIRDFIVCTGYKSYIVKEYFLNYHLHTSDVTIQLSSGAYTVSRPGIEDWNVQIVDTGLETQTGGRLRRVGHLLGDETFCLTYGDGLSDINISDQLKFHLSHGKVATVAAVKPPGRFATLDISDNGQVNSFREKPDDEIGWVSGGFFILNTKVLDYIHGDDIIFERGPLEALAELGELAAYRHTGFWKALDTLRDKRDLEKEFQSGARWLLDSDVSAK